MKATMRFTVTGKIYDKGEEIVGMDETLAQKLIDRGLIDDGKEKKEKKTKTSEKKENPTGKK